MNNLEEPLTFVLDVTRLDVIKLLVPATLGFIVGILITPRSHHSLHVQVPWWKKKSVDLSVMVGKRRLQKNFITMKLERPRDRAGLSCGYQCLLLQGFLWFLSSSQMVILRMR